MQLCADSSQTAAHNCSGFWAYNLSYHLNWYKKTTEIKRRTPTFNASQLREEESGAQLSLCIVKCLHHTRWWVSTVFMKSLNNTENTLVFMFWTGTRVRRGLLFISMLKMNDRNIVQTLGAWLPTDWSIKANKTEFLLAHIHNLWNRSTWCGVINAVGQMHKPVKLVWTGMKGFQKPYFISGDIPFFLKHACTIHPRPGPGC